MAGRRVLLVLEDLQWADAPTTVLLRYVLTSPRGAPVAIVATLRSTELGDEHPLSDLLADLHREPRVTRMMLAGLDLEEVETLTGAFTGQKLDARGRALAAQLHANTGGNPFFITELLRGLTEARPRGEAFPPSDINKLFRRLPTSITETLHRRLIRLGEDARRCLSAAAVVGNEFNPDLLSATGIDTAVVTDALERAVRTGLLVSVEEYDPRLRFAHALIDQWLYGELSPTERGDLHRQIAEGLERGVGSERVSVTTLAHHWFQAASRSNIETPLRYAVLAGDEALERLAPQEACRWFGRALDLRAQRVDSDETEHCELLLKLGEGQQQAGDVGFRATLLEAAQIALRTGDSGRLVRVALANTRGLQSSSGIVDHQRIAVLDEAIGAVGQQPCAERALLLATQAVELAFSGEWRRRVALSDEALALARTLGDPATLATVLNLRFLTIWAPETHRERLENTAESLSVCRRLRDPVALFYAYHWRVAACIEGADAAEARRCMALERSLADDVRQPTLLWLAACHDSDLALIDGRLEDAERAARAAFEIGQGSEPDALACYAAQLCAIRYEQGRLSELVDLLGNVVDSNPGIPGFRAILVCALCHAGHPDRAREALAPAVATRFEDLPYDVTWLAVVCIYADGVTRLSNHTAARVLLGLLEPWDALISYPGFGVGASAAHWLAELALSVDELDLAERYHAKAIQLHDRLGGPVWVARSHYQAARLLLARGRRAAAEAALSRALTLAEDIGMQELAQLARTALSDRPGARL